MTGTGRWAGLLRETLQVSTLTQSEEYGTMQAALTPPGDSRTYLTHLVGSGLDDNCYVVQRYL